MSRTRAVALALLAAGLLAGCGLPLRPGVHQPGAVPAQPALPQPIGVLPPDPLPGATPTKIVESFRTAQSSARDGHRIAREFLAADRRAAWDDAAGVTVYDPLSVTYQESYEADTAVVLVGTDVIGGVARDGQASVQPPQHQTQTYRLSRDGSGQWRVVSLPTGLTLTPGDRDRAYTPADVYFLAPPVAGLTARHVVADRLLLPSLADRARLVVERLLAGPSAALGDSARSAVPTGTRLLSAVTTSANGEVTVNLSREAAGAPLEQRQNMTAQLFWSIRPQVAAFSRLRVMVAGSALDIGASTQPRQAWVAYDPDGPRRDPPAYALLNGQLDLLGRSTENPRAPLSDVRGIVDAAVDPGGQTIAVLTQSGAARTVRLGPLKGQTAPTATLAVGPTDPGLRSPSWGSGERGLWLVRTGVSPAVLLIAGDGSSTTVPVENLPDLGAAPVLRVSRDGVRLALVGGGILYVGRVVTTAAGGSVRVVDLQQRATNVVDVAWQTGTTLMVLVRDTRPLLPLLRLSVDGTAATASGLLGVDQGDPVAIAASGEQPLLVETVRDGTSTTFRSDGGRGFALGLDNARRPFYPG